MQSHIPLSALLIQKHILAASLQKQLKIEVFSTLASTNQYLKTLPTHANKHLHVCLAEEQTAGRGRLGRYWHSPYGMNLYFSLLWKTVKEINALNGLSLVVGLAVVKTLEQCGVTADLKLKWPNDVLWQGKKLVGVLLELNADANGVSQIIIGIGLNINMPSTDIHPIDQPWIAMESILGSSQDRNYIAAKLIENLTHYLQHFEAVGFGEFLSEWHDYDALYGKTIHLEHQASLLTGIARGLDERGYLLVQHAEGEMSAYSSGEVRIRK